MKEFIKAIAEREGFNYLSRGNCWDFSKDEYRTIIKELLYAIEEGAVIDYSDISDIFLENMADYLNED